MGTATTMLRPRGLGVHEVPPSMGGVRRYRRNHYSNFLISSPPAVAFAEDMNLHLTV